MPCCPLREGSFLVCAKAFGVYFPSPSNAIPKSEWNLICRKWASLVFQLSRQNVGLLSFICTELFFKRGLLCHQNATTLNIEGALFLFDIMSLSLGLHTRNYTITMLLHVKSDSSPIISIANMLSCCVIRSICRSTDPSILKSKPINLFNHFLLTKPLLLLWTRVILVFPPLFWSSEAFWLIYSIGNTFSIDGLKSLRHVDHLSTLRPFEFFGSHKITEHVALPTQSLGQPTEFTQKVAFLHHVIGNYQICSYFFKNHNHITFKSSHAKRSICNRCRCLEAFYVVGKAAA